MTSKLTIAIVAFFSVHAIAISAIAKEPMDDIVSAAKNKDWQQVTSLIAHNANVGAKSPDGMTALHWSTLHGNSEVAFKLIKAGADVSPATIYEVTPLQIACKHGRTLIAKRLLEKGAEIDTRYISGETLLMQASRFGSVELVKLLIDNGADPTEKDESGQTSLMWAAAAGHADVVQQLIDSGASIDKNESSGFTALCFAAREGKIEAAQCLVAAGADVNKAMDPKNTNGRAPRKGMSPLMLAVESGHFELALELIELGADPNDQRSGYAPLHAISWARKPNRGDDIHGDPAPRGSGKVSSLDFARAIVDAGADVNLQLKNGGGGKARLNSKGGTPMLFAARTADLGLLKLLVELGGDVNTPNAEQCTPLMAAAGVGVFVAGEFAGTEPEVIDSIKFLHERGAKISSVDANGETTMHGAAYRSFPKVVELLVSLKIDSNVFSQKNKLGSTPLQVAQGKRPGSFKPDKPTIRAIRSAMNVANETSDSSNSSDKQ